MTGLHARLELPRCPHCNVDHPNLVLLGKYATQNHAGQNQRFWGVYRCERCGGVATAVSATESGAVSAVYPTTSTSIEDALPARAKAFLRQGFDSRHAPAGAVILAASAVDAMLKSKGYTTGSLYARIDQAQSDHLITDGMAAWAHQVRLDANDQRHADEDSELPTESDAQRSLDFAAALGQLLFVLPARVERGLADSGKR